MKIFGVCNDEVRGRGLRTRGGSGRREGDASSPYLKLVPGDVSLFYLFTFKKASPPNRADSWSSSLVRDRAT